MVDACSAYASWQMRMRGTSIRRARKSLKRIRAILSLIQGGIDEDAYVRMCRDCREMGRCLGPLRDRDVVRSLLDRLADDAGDSQDLSAIRLAAAVLEASEPTLVVRDHRAEEQIVAAVEGEATRVLQSLDTIVFDRVDRDLVLDQIERHWRRASARFHGDFRSGDTEWLHATRKRVIRAQLSLQPLSKIRPASIRRSTKAVKHIADLLGDDHDLAVLSGLIDAHRERMVEAGGVAAIELEIERRRTAMQNSSLLHGREVFEGSPEEMRERLRSWWRQAAKRDPGEG